ncbi:MAG: F0F1 ATP synthase subunit B [Alphaproteobacteria bacterium]
MEELIYEPKNWVALSFLLFFALFIKKILPLINKGLDGRRARIEDQLAQASRLREEAEQLLVRYQQKQKAMLAEAEQMLADTKAEITRLKARAEEELKASLERRSAQASERIARIEKEATDAVRAHLVNVAVKATELLMKETLKDRAEDPTITRAVEQIRKLH